MDKTAKVTYLSLLLIVGFAASVGYNYIQGGYFGRPYPYSTFLFDPAERGGDFSDVLRDGHTLSPYVQYASAQYPFLAFLGFALAPLGGLAYPTFVLLVTASHLALSAASLRMATVASTLLHVFVIALLSYPFLFAVDRGNFELLVFVLLLASLHLFARGRPEWSAVFLGLAIALKLYPVVLLAIYAPTKNLRAALLALGVAAAATLGSLLCFEGGLWANASYLLQTSNFQSNWMFREFTSFSSHMVQRGVSLLTFIKWLSIETGFIRGMGDALFLSRYLATSALVAVAAVLYTVFIEKELWKRIAILVLLMLLLPPLSADYKLLLLYLPLYPFIESGRRSRLDPAFLVVFGLLLIPKNYGYLSSVISETRAAHDISIAVPANIALLLLLGLMIVAAGVVQWIHQARRATVPTAERLADKAGQDPLPGRVHRQESGGQDVPLGPKMSSGR